MDAGQLKEALWGLMPLKAHSCSRDRTTETTAGDTDQNTRQPHSGDTSQGRMDSE